MEALQGDRGWDLLRVTSPRSPSARTLPLTPSASEQACAGRGRWPWTLLSRIHWHPKTPAKGAWLMYAPTTTPALAQARRHTEHTPLLHTAALTSRPDLETKVCTLTPTQPTAHCRRHLQLDIYTYPGVYTDILSIWVQVFLTQTHSIR